MLYSPVEKYLLKGFPLLGKIPQLSRIFWGIRARIGVGFVRVAGPGFFGKLSAARRAEAKDFTGEFPGNYAGFGGWCRINELTGQLDAWCGGTPVYGIIGAFYISTRHLHPFD